MNRQTKSWIALVLMVATSIAATAIKPTELLAATRGDAKLEDIVPTKFGEWRELESSGKLVVNPQQTELLKKLYSQTLSRTYVRADGGVIMLSIAYGNNQSDGLALHYPDVCYPAQGFRVTQSQYGTLTTNMGTIRVKRLATELGNRKEPLTYWATIGDGVVQGGTETKLAQLHYGFRGQIPDGLIFRVSSITRDTELAYKLQEQFVTDLLTAIPASQRKFLSGISASNAS